MQSFGPDKRGERQGDGQGLRHRGQSDLNAPLSAKVAYPELDSAIKELCQQFRVGSPLQSLGTTLDRVTQLLLEPPISGKFREMLFAVRNTKSAIDTLLTPNPRWTTYESRHLASLINWVQKEYENAANGSPSFPSNSLQRLREYLAPESEGAAKREMHEQIYWDLRQQSGLVRVAAHRATMWYRRCKEVIDGYTGLSGNGRTEIMPPQELCELMYHASNDLSVYSMLNRKPRESDPVCIQQIGLAQKVFFDCSQTAPYDSRDGKWLYVGEDLYRIVDILRDNHLRIVPVPDHDGDFIDPLVDEFRGVCKFITKPKPAHEGEMLVDELEFKIYNNTPMHPHGEILIPPITLWHELEELQREWVIDPAWPHPQIALEKVFSAGLLWHVFDSTNSRLVVSRFEGKLSGFTLFQVGRNGMLPDKEATLLELENHGEHPGDDVAWMYLAVASRDFIKAGARYGFDAHGWQNQTAMDVCVTQGIGTVYGRVRIGEQGNAAVRSHQRIGYSLFPVIVDYTIDQKRYEAQVVGARPFDSLAGHPV